jgi:hypothetical protein
MPYLDQEERHQSKKAYRESEKRRLEDKGGGGGLNVDEGGIY